ncbi:hypothetical protein WJX73_002107 [Symbiochloris irregularis]|uniref:Uncharacterized protein n=1 Tax=Symbiochloris irregularis TaxID=706552 RepID=A0AAW1NNF0_9CHLO
MQGTLLLGISKKWPAGMAVNINHEGAQIIGGTAAARSDNAPFCDDIREDQASRDSTSISNLSWLASQSAVQGIFLQSQTAKACLTTVPRT